MCWHGNVAIEDVEHESKEKFRNFIDINATRSGNKYPSVCKCGLANRENRIIGGQETEIHEYPWQVALVNRGRIRPFCGGSLVNSRWVLSAAHCFKRPNPRNIQVLLGNHRTDDWKDVRFNVAEINNHPDYNFYVKFDFDFSMLKLSQEIHWAYFPEIRPVCLPTNPSNDYAGWTATTTGWGLTEWGFPSNALLEVDLTVLTNYACRYDYGWPSYKISDSMLCATVWGGGKSACKGDSGGPLVTASGDGVTPGQNYQLIGVVSFGPKRCGLAAYPGVFARVTSVLDWIYDHMSIAGETCPAT